MIRGGFILLCLGHFGLYIFDLERAYQYRNVFCGANQNILCLLSSPWLCVICLSHYYGFYSLNSVFCVVIRGEL